MQRLDETWLRQVEHDSFNAPTRRLGMWYNRRIHHAIEQVLRNRQTELETITIIWQVFYRDHPECDVSWIPWVCDQICNEFDWANELGTLFLPSDGCAILWRTWKKTWTDDLALPCFFATLEQRFGACVSNAWDELSPKTFQSLSLGTFCSRVGIACQERSVEG